MITFMSIKSDQFLEVLFLRIRGETIKAVSANIKLLEDKQIELENLCKHKINRCITKTQMQCFQEG